MSNEELQSKVIDFLRFPMIVGIVLLHAFLEDIRGLNIPDGGLPIYHHASFFISRVLVFVAVPLFFFISAYLFFYHTSFSFESYKKKLKKRAHTLLIPYLFWNLVIIVGHWMVTLLSPVQLTSGAYKLIEDYTWWDYLRSFWAVNGSMPINGVLWFIRDLMIMMVLSPVVYFMIRYLRWIAVLLIGGIWLSGVTCDIPQMSAIFFFTLGAWYSINRRNFVADFKSFFPWGILLYFIYALGTVATREYTGFVYVSNAGILLGIVAVIALTAHYVEKGKWRASVFLTGSCFLVYAFHQLPLNIMVRILFRLIHPVSDGQFLFIYLISPVTIILMDLLIYAILKRFLPKFTIFITGGRS
ncbi:MAG: acyltransferase [Bacteroides sp.]|jgi:fucose 4-O-acetylase-like acetyltransferase|nr:acyltransferase [Bacteroides sp.]